MTGIAAYRTHPPKETTFLSGPWVGMNDATQPVASDPTHAQLLQNLWTRDVPHVPFADGRPGFSKMGLQQGDASNLVKQSEAFGTAPWAALLATVTANTTTAPDTTVTADTLTGDGAANNGYVNQNVTVPMDDTYVVSLYVKAGTSTDCRIEFGNLTGGGGYHNVQLTFAAGVPTVTSVTGPTAGSVFATTGPDGAGFYRVAFTVRNVFAANTNTLFIQPCASGAFGRTLIVWGAQVTQGLDLVPYVKTTTTASTAQTTSQRHYQFTKLDGTEYTVWFVGGKLLTYNWTTSTWSEPVTAANLTTKAITLSTTARVYCKTFANTLVVSDGVNVPFTWDGTAGSGGLVKLTNCPVLYGQPDVYYGKLVGIKAAERNAWVWSVEGDPTTGYEAGGYNNAWKLGQTDQEGFYALAATDTALTFFRERGITQVYGRVTTDFQSTGTLDAISQTVGTISPAGVLVYDKVIYFPGSDQRFYKIVGNQLSEVAVGARTTFGGASQANLVNAVAAPWMEASLIVFGVPEVSQTYPNWYFVVNPENDELAGFWRGWVGPTLDAVKDGDGVAVVVHGGGDRSSVATGNTAGYSYLHGNPDGTVWDDGFAAATVAISHSLTAGFLGYDLRTDKFFHQVDVSLLTPTDLGSLTVSTVTPRGIGSSNLAIAVTGSGDTRWDQFNWDEANWAGVGGEQHTPAGLSSQGRWMSLTLGHAAVGERFQVQALLVRAFPLDQRARML